MSDVYEMRIKSYATECPTCVCAVHDGTATHDSLGLLRDGVLHALTLDKSATLCGEKNNAEEVPK